MRWCTRVCGTCRRAGRAVSGHPAHDAHSSPLRTEGRPRTSGMPASPSGGRSTPRIMRPPRHTDLGRPADGGRPRAPGQRELRDDVRRRLGSAGCADGDLRLIRQGPRTAVLQRPGARAAGPRPRLAPAPGRADSQPKAALGARAGPHAVGALCAGPGHARPPCGARQGPALTGPDRPAARAD